MNDDILNAKNGTTGGANPFNTNNTTNNNNAANVNTGSGSDSNPRFSGMPTMASQAKPQVQSQPVSQPVPLMPKPQFQPQPQPQPQTSTQMPQAPRPQQPYSAPAVHVSLATPVSSAAPIASVNPVMPRPAPIQAMPQKPYAPTPTPAQSYVQSVQAAPLPSSTQPSLQQQVFMQNAAYLKAQQMRTNKGSSKGVLVTIIILLIIASAAGAIWFLKPADVPLTKYLGISTIMDMIKGKGSSTDTIEDKVANPEEQPAENQNSAFPTGVLNSGSQTGTQTNTAAKPVKPVTKTSNTYSMSDQDAVASYIRNNINKIARTTGYVVTDITFDGPARAVVSYSKGSIVRSAVISTSISATGAVKVTGFTPLTK